MKYNLRYVIQIRWKLVVFILGDHIRTVTARHKTHDLYVTICSSYTQTRCITTKR